jgi:hypothetical protein
MARPRAVSRTRPTADARLSRVRFRACTSSATDSPITSASGATLPLSATKTCSLSRATSTRLCPAGSKSRARSAAHSRRSRERGPPRPRTVPGTSVPVDTTGGPVATNSSIHKAPKGKSRALWHPTSRGPRRDSCEWQGDGTCWRVAESAEGGLAPPRLGRLGPRRCGYARSVPVSKSCLGRGVAAVAESS